MDIKDANKVIQNLQTKPYICSENTMELDNGYVIAKKEYFKELKKKADQLTDCEDPGEQGKRSDGMLNLFTQKTYSRKNMKRCLRR